MQNMLLTPEQAFVLSKKYTEDTAEEFGGLKGASCQIQSIIKNGTTNTVTFVWENSQGETRTGQMIVEDGTPIYVWTSGNSYKYGDLVIYESAWYRCITPNSDVVFDATKWNEIGSADGNYDIVERTSYLPERFTPADRKMYFSIEELIFYLWDGYKWVPINDYETLDNKPEINGVELVGNKSSNDLGIQVISVNQDKLIIS